MPGAFWETCISPLFPEGGAPAGSPGPGPWRSCMVSARLQPSWPTSSGVQFSSTTIRPLADIQAIEKMKNTGGEGKRARLSSKGNGAAKLGLEGCFAERNASGERAGLQPGALGGQDALH